MNVQTMRQKRITFSLLMYFLMARQARDICSAPNNLPTVLYMEVPFTGANEYVWYAATWLAIIIHIFIV